MLKYVMALGFLSFCNSHPRIVGTYTQLVLSQHYILPSFFGQKFTERNDIAHFEKFALYMRDRFNYFDNENWTIYGFWALNSLNRNNKFCQSASGVNLTYNSADLDTNLTKELSEKWLLFNPFGKEETHWQAQYNEYGSCVTANVTEYFREAIRLFEQYNMKKLLEEARIIPGGLYNVNNIADALTKAVGKRVYLKCSPAQNPDEQYLLEVQICFSASRNVVNCQHRRRKSSGNHLCNPGLPVFHATSDIIF